MPPDANPSSADVLAGALRRIAQRIRFRIAARAGAVVVIICAVLLTVFKAVHAPPIWASAGLIVGAAVAWASALHARRNTWSAAAAAAQFELANPHSRNVVVTAQELIDHPDRARPWIRTRVFDDAATAVHVLDLAKLVPVRGVTITLLGAVALLAVVIAAFPAREGTLWRRAGEPSTAAGARPRSSVATRTVATVVAPAYTGVALRTLEGPQRIDAVEGSRLHFEVRGEGTFRIRFGTMPLPVKTGDSVAGTDLALTTSGYLAVESDPGHDLLFLIPVAVTPDRAPTIRIENPGKDLLTSDAKATVALAASATDDFGLQSLDLRYTKVSGSGEQFEFVEGTLPLDIAKETGQSWKGKGAIALGRLGLQPGDALVYRVVARDLRPGDGGSASSDTFFIEVAGPGQVALEGFEMPPDRERYALSQQMIVLKIQRLRAREASMARDAVQQETASIAAEQRAVRANFVFLMGGQVEDEEQEAEQSHEIQEGRLENSARREINTAIQYMSHAEQALVAVDSGQALPPAKAAADALQRAFGRNRYFLRTLPVRSRVDPSRRLSGDLKEASNWRRELNPADVDRRISEARRILSRLLTKMPATLEDRSRARSAISALAEEALAVDPASADWQEISKRLGLLSGALGDTSSQEQDVAARWREAVAPLVTAAEKSAVSGEPRSSSALRSAWADEVRRR